MKEVGGEDKAATAQVDMATRLSAAWIRLRSKLASSQFLAMSYLLGTGMGSLSRGFTTSFYIESSLLIRGNRGCDPGSGIRVEGSAIGRPISSSQVWWMLIGSPNRSFLPWVQYFEGEPLVSFFLNFNTPQFCSFIIYFFQKGETFHIGY